MKKKTKRNPKLTASEMRAWLSALKMVEKIRHQRTVNIINEASMKITDPEATNRAVVALCVSLLGKLSAGGLGA